MTGCIDVVEASDKSRIHQKSSYLEDSTTTYLLPNSCKDVSAILHGPNMLLTQWLNPSVCTSTSGPTLHSLFLPGPIHELAQTPIPFLSIGYHVPTPSTPKPADQYRQLCNILE